MGFRKMETATVPESVAISRACLMREKWPRWRAPMVGTRTRLLSMVDWVLRNSLSCWMDWVRFIRCC